MMFPNEEGQDEWGTQQERKSGGARPGVIYEVRGHYWSNRSTELTWCYNRNIMELSWVESCWNWFCIEACWAFWPWTIWLRYCARICRASLEFIVGGDTADDWVWGRSVVGLERVTLWKNKRYSNVEYWGKSQEYLNYSVDILKWKMFRIY